MSEEVKQLKDEYENRVRTPYKYYSLRDIKKKCKKSAAQGYNSIEVSVKKIRHEDIKELRKRGYIVLRKDKTACGLVKFGSVWIVQFANDVVDALSGKKDLGELVDNLIECSDKIKKMSK